MAQIELQAKTRTASGNAVRALRRDGMTPVNVYGHATESTALQMETPKLEQVLKQAGETRLIRLWWMNTRPPEWSSLAKSRETLFPVSCFTWPSIRLK